MGEVSTTVTGKTCKRWDNQSPHSKNIPKWDHNHCRGTINVFSKGAWCYTTDDHSQWEYCSQIEGILLFFQIIFISLFETVDVKQLV